MNWTPGFDDLIEKYQRICFTQGTEFTKTHKLSQNVSNS